MSNTSCPAPTGHPVIAGLTGGLNFGFGCAN